MNNPRQHAIKKMIELAKQGNINALQDLLIILKPTDNPEQIFAEIYFSEECTLKQKWLIEQQASKKDLSINRIVNLAQEGNIDALNDLISLLELGKLNIQDNTKWADFLFTIFTSNTSTPEQRKLIWSKKDVQVYIQEIIHNDSERNSDETYTWYEYIKFSFHEYVKPYLKMAVLKSK